MLPQYVGSWARHVRSWTETPGLCPHVIRYEDVWHDPHRTFAALLRFLNLPVEPGRLDKAIRFCSFTELAAQEQRCGFVEARPDGRSRFFRAGRVGEGREVLNARQQRELFRALGDVMAAFGYTGRGPVDRPSRRVVSEPAPVLTR